MRQLVKNFILLPVIIDDTTLPQGQGQEDIHMRYNPLCLQSISDSQSLRPLSRLRRAKRAPQVRASDRNGNQIDF